MLSIIVPIYNVEKFLPKCIESIMCQTYADIQIILVDDGSPDNCPKICDNYALYDSRIQVIHQPNSGVSAARNAGLQIAMGEYIGFVDPDDYIVEDMYEKMITTMEKYNADMVLCGYDYVNEDGCIIKPYITKIDQLLNQKEYMSMQFDMPPTVRHGVCNKIFKKKYFKDLSFMVDMHSAEDVFIMSECLKRIKNIVFIHKPLYKNTVRQGSATHGGLKIESLADSFVAHNKMYMDTIALYPELKNHGIAFTLDVCTLKYNEAKQKYMQLEKNERHEIKQTLRKMRKYIKRLAIKAIFNPEIYWKTRIAYLLLR